MILKVLFYLTNKYKELKNMKEFSYAHLFNQKYSKIAKY